MAAEEAGRAGVALSPEVVRVLLERERLALAGRLLPGVVHNLSGAVQTMSLPLDLARLALQQNQVDKLAAKLENLREGLERLTSEVGLLARRSQTDRRASAEPLDLAALAGRELDFWQAELFLKHEVDLQRELPPDLPLALASPADVSLAFNLLLANALEAVRPHSSPMIKVRVLAVEGGLALEVADSGPGPDPAMAERMFEAFVGIKGEGHDGLGLFLAARALEPWGGAVAWLPDESLTIFRLTLPKN
ncbi:MAG: HAMP domain-containing histidine kinase [Desulfarculaceae bacterium]|nr:HAMP domain-containing histidine kinase [Desulfarculaceae bacterium]MCF8073075.1 HAMP domain-containing histidine kinase [Desulfarculaceae bacterium]MCF8101840.1 HAMP domain-containing histidine kinase [Desulfarculaceae bacterium]MCF8115367.1 HAMP domain-containing histidine kinase [Desulfarculaceae bacterium]